MKLSKTLSLLLAAALAFVQLTAAVPPVQAQEDTGNNPWRQVFDQEGNLLPGVADLGEVELNPAPGWWPSGWLQQFADFYPTYHQYVSANGDVVLAPSATTLLLMAFNAEESGLLNSTGYLANGGGSVVMNIMLATQGGQNIFDRIGDFGYTDPNAFIDAVIDGEAPIWSFGFQDDLLQMMLELHRISREDDMLATTLLIYIQGTCAGAPTGCPAELCQLAPLACQEDEAGGEPDPLPPTCPDATVTVGNPVITIYPVAPQNPLVVGQDPERRGVDVQLEVSIPPTRHEYYTAEPVWAEVETCQVPAGAPGGELNCKTDPALPANNGRLQSSRELVDIVCEYHLQIYPEPVAGVSAQAHLSGDGQAWIEQDLGAYYYGAAVYQTTHDLIPGLAPVSVSCNDQQVCLAGAFIPRIQLRDPGRYSLTVQVQTAGTPVTGGRLLTGSGEVSVALLAVRLIDPQP